MKPIVYFLLLIFALISCCGQEKNKSNATTSNPIVSENKDEKRITDNEPEVETDLIINPDYVFDKEGELKFDSPQYTIYFIENNEDVGGLLVVYDKPKNQTCSVAGRGTYYYGVYDKYLIIDEGTGTMRTFYVFDLDTRNAVYKSPYNAGSDSYNPETGKLCFETKVEKLPAGASAEIDEEQKDAFEAYSSMFGYAEKRSFDFNTLKEERTGKFKYQYYQ